MCTEIMRPINCFSIMNSLMVNTFLHQHFFTLNEKHCFFSFISTVLICGVVLECLMFTDVFRIGNSLF